MGVDASGLRDRSEHREFIHCICEFMGNERLSTSETLGDNLGRTTVRVGARGHTSHDDSTVIGTERFKNVETAASHIHPPLMPNGDSTVVGAKQCNNSIIIVYLVEIYI